MIERYAFFALLTLAWTATTWGQSGLGIFNIATDTSLIKYEAVDQIYSLTAVADGNYPTVLAKELKGDFIITATFGSVNEYANWEGIGWMVQSPTDFYASLLNSAYNVYVTRQAQGRGEIIARDQEKFEIMQMERSGSKLIVRAATPGGPLEPICEVPGLAFPDRVRSGIFLGGERLVTAGIWNVRIERPVENLNGDRRETIPSKLETVDVLTGVRKIEFQSSNFISKAQYLPGDDRLLFQEGDTWKSVSLKDEDEWPTESDPSKLPSYRLQAREEAIAQNDDGSVVIYFIREVDGKQKIWRKNEDGSGEVQITSDDYNDSFPNVSPDGYWISFLSHPVGVEPTTTHGYRRAMIRLLPVAGGSPEVVTHLVASNGTMSVPCWSYDSQFIAFVSYTGW